MQYRQLGKTGMHVSALCLGTMQFGWTADEQTSFEVLNEAFEAGINFIDTADVYSRWVEGNPGGVSEAIIGKWLKSGAAKRAQLILATKVRSRMGEGPNDEGLSRLHILASIEGSLRRLGTDYVDLYQTHWPDDHTPIEETLAAMQSLVQQGKVRYIGCSNYPAWRLMQALWASDVHGWMDFSSLQPHYNLVHRDEYERELEQVCQTYRIGVIPYSPLAAGFLTGKYQPGAEAPLDGRLRGNPRLARLLNEPRNLQALESAKQQADQLGATASQVSLAWLLARPAITSPIIGPRSVEQLRDNLGALDVNLDAAAIEALNSASEWRSG